VNKRIVFSMLLIVAIVAATATVTWAWFSANRTEAATITTARIGIGETSGFPLTFSNMLPGEVMSVEFSVKNTGNRDADFYSQLVGYTTDDENNNPRYMNFCLGTLGDEALRVSIHELDAAGGDVVYTWVNNAKICNMYPGHPNSVIHKIGDDVALGIRKYYQVDVKLAAAAGNDYMDKLNTDYVNLIAVQYNGPAPQPDRDSYYSAWPTDIDDDDDPNYP
jgi:predicted ribosomally synthesized peptide with SipW-like signal peptide